MARRGPPPDLDVLSDDELLEQRLCDLGLRIEGSWLEPLVEQARRELSRRGLEFGARFWLSDEWLSPAGVPGVGVPFYLAHPRLIRLERSQMLEVEGGTRKQCMMLLRHELGHAIDHAYRLHRRQRWREAFGSSSQPYPEWYRPNPASRRFVQHLDAWYAQAHPDEDFAETFAVWLNPRSRWRERYATWPALRKLEAVDQLMDAIAGTEPAVRSRERPYSLPSFRLRLKTYYKRKRERFNPGYSTNYDDDLRRLFDEGTNSKRAPTAAAFLRKHSAEIRGHVVRWTEGQELTVDYVLRHMIGRCRELGLRAKGPKQQLLMDFSILLTVHSMTYLYRGREWHAM
ncbi:putative zinc-binding metallopeptidase [Plesiocystis pacifica]|uniref:putative zinc-binding metallopeptidase n=1 Tax=Plesiocystis pacifica TaxID=191768 RepID=UPI0005D4739F